MIDIKQKEIVLKGSGILFIANIICFVLGYIRDVFIVRNFGASYITDAWYIAISIPELLFKFTFFSAFSASFIPLFVDYLQKKKEIEAWRIASSVINLFMIALVILVILGICFSSFLVYFFAPGFDRSTHLISTQLLRVVLGIIVFMAIGGILEAIYRSYFNYSLTAISQIINISVILLFIIFYTSKIGIFSIAWGTFFGFFSSFIFLIIFLFIYSKPYRFIIDIRHPAIKKIFNLAIPLILAEIIGKGIGVVDRFFASFLDKGLITAFDIANRLVAFPIIFFSTTISTALFPLFLYYARETDKHNFLETISFSIKISLLVIIPCIAGFIIFGKQIIRILFEYGKFSSTDTHTTWRILLFLSPVLVAFSLRPILVKVCYSLKKNWILFRYELLGFILNIILDYILMKFMGIVGIALATTITVSVMVIYLLWTLRDYFDNLINWAMILFLCKIFFATVLMGVYGFFIFDTLTKYIQFYLKDVINLCFTLILSVFVYYIVLRTLKVKELELLWKTFKNSIIKI